MTHPITWFRAIANSLLPIFALVAAPAESFASCEPLDLQRHELIEWRTDRFATDDPQRAALELLPCLADSDPFLRDSIGYEGLTVLLRGEKVSAATRRLLIARLEAMMRYREEDGFAAPFAALALSEVVRTDRIYAFLDDRERAALVSTAASYLHGVSDYRGFIDGEGWRHGVAHGADLALQLTLNPGITGTQRQELLRAIATQITPDNGHAYVFGEPARLARPVLYAALSGSVEEAFWDTWFEALADPTPLASWAEVFASEPGLARLHNLRAFAQALFVGAVMSEEPSLQGLRLRARVLLEALP